LPVETGVTCCRLPFTMSLTQILEAVSYMPLRLRTAV
jgi:hypothetical protein